MRLELDGEKCTKFFFQQIEKHKNSKQDMLSINRIKDGKLLTNERKSYLKLEISILISMRRNRMPIYADGLVPSGLWNKPHRLKVEQ